MRDLVAKYITEFLNSFDGARGNNDGKVTKTNCNHINTLLNESRNVCFMLEGISETFDVLCVNAYFYIFVSKSNISKRIL